MAAIAECLEETYPDVGGPYRQRIHQLRSRVAYDATREAIQSSVNALQSELKDYASVAQRVSTQRGIESKRGILALGDIIEKLAERRELFGNHLLHVANQVENMPWLPDPRIYAETKARHAAALRDLVGRMNAESVSMLAQLRDRMEEMDHRLAGASSTDPVTGLVNRSELERQIEAHKLHGSTFALLLFELQGPMSDQVVRLAAARLGTKFRHCDWIGRWSPVEFAVLFLGEPEIAQARAAQAVAALEGRYMLENGETVVVAAKTRLLQAEFAAV